MSDTVDRPRGDRGRPRSGTAPRPDLSPRDQILDAAAHLFVERGYAATSTRAIADEVGIRQASLYYHFPSKESILEVLLLRTVEPSVLVADLITASSRDPAARLCALILFDAGQLFTGTYNIGTLYFLPEVRLARFDAFRAERARLREMYARLVRTSRIDGVDAPDLLADIVFGMVESSITIRADRTEASAGILVPTIARGCLRVLGHDEAAIAAIKTEAEGLLEDLGCTPHSG